MRTELWEEWKDQAGRRKLAKNSHVARTSSGPSVKRQKRGFEEDANPNSIPLNAHGPIIPIRTDSHTYKDQPSQPTVGDTDSPGLAGLHNRLIGMRSTNPRAFSRPLKAPTQPRSSYANGQPGHHSKPIPDRSFGHTLSAAAQRHLVNEGGQELFPGRRFSQNAPRTNTNSDVADPPNLDTETPKEDERTGPAYDRSLYRYNDRGSPIRLFGPPPSDIFKAPRFLDHSTKIWSTSAAKVEVSDKESESDDSDSSGNSENGPRTDGKRKRTATDSSDAESSGSEF